MALARIKTWNAGDTLTAADLNAEFNNPLNNPISLVSPTTGAINFQTSVAHTNLTPSAINTTSGSTGQILTISTAGTAVWFGSGISTITVNNSSTTFSITTSTASDVVGSSMTISVRATTNRVLLQGGANVNVGGVTGGTQSVWVQLATSTGVIANSSQNFGVTGQVGAGLLGAAAWSIPFSPGTTASRQYTIQTLLTVTSGTGNTLPQWDWTAIEISL